MLNFDLIGKRIKKLRLEKHLTQEKLSELLNISIEHLSRIESGAYRPSLGLIEKISTALETDEAYLMFGNYDVSGIDKELYDKLESLEEDKKQALLTIINSIK